MVKMLFNRTTETNGQKNRIRSFAGGLTRLISP